MAYTTMAALVTKLKLRLKPQTSDGWTDPGDYQSFITDAAYRHNASYTVEVASCNLPGAEAVLVVLLAWHDMLMVRSASFAGQSNNSGSSGFGTDRNTPYYKCTDLAEKVLKQYREQCRDKGLGTYAGGSAPELTLMTYVQEEQPYFGYSFSSPCSIDADCRPSSNGCAIVGVMSIKVGEEFSVSLYIPVNPPVSWTGIVGYSQIRDSSNALLYDMGTVAGTVDGSGNATINFIAAGTITADWAVGTYYVDFSFAVVGVFGPKTTGTYKLIVCEPVTSAP